MTEAETPGQSEPGTLTSQAREAFNRRRFDLAAGLYRRLTELEPAEGGHQLKLADALRHLGCRRMASEAFLTAARLFHDAGERERAIAACRSAIALQAVDDDVQRLLSQLARGTGDSGLGDRPVANIHHVTDTLTPG